MFISTYFGPYSCSKPELLCDSHTNEGGRSDYKL